MSGQPTAPARRRTLLLGAAALLGGLCVRTGAAQDPPIAMAERAPAPAAGEPAPAPTRPPPRRRPRRRAAQRPEPAPAPMEPPSAAPRLDPAPVPNRTVEAPRSAAPSASPSFGPSIIHRPLPNSGAAREGARTYDEERLFFPAPGARLTVPFRY